MAFPLSTNVPMRLQTHIVCKEEWSVTCKGSQIPAWKLRAGIIRITNTILMTLPKALCILVRLPGELVGVIIWKIPFKDS